MDEIQQPSPAPDLPGWLAARSEQFADWCRETGASEGTWDFSAASLETLEGLIRARYRGEEQIHADRLSLFLQGACWYVGEVAVRHRGYRWHYWPFAGPGEPLPAIFASGEPGVIDSPSVGAPRAKEGKGTDPLGLILTLFWTVDDIDEPVEAHLTDILTD
ncbi:hypothetical protein G5C51_22560 [Streptomyces sp. A7024]|uniref:Uncharacterized protein n=1 Tax=Streptomyces coryli TaxID=1128680 RepID=A0A6G4U3L4_9ACTN|nr:hypothetical protein [Streptomyces coryli]NGN66673.1 hypothetical protein [Streptomyces coryli]